MKFLIDINHPAHVHYFKNFIRIMEAHGHKVKVTNRDSMMINQLLDYYQINHIIRNRRPRKKGTLRSLLYLVGIIKHCVNVSISFKPDMYIGFASSACAITSFFFRKPCILMDDTEHNSMNHRLYKPFCSVVLTPFYFKKKLGSKQISFNAYVEQLYLHSNYYRSNESILKELSVTPQNYILIRYIAYDAHHDLVAHPLSEDTKKRIIKLLSKKYSVLLSIENGNSDAFYEPYILNISPEKMHDVEANAKLMITEGATMASESFVQGVPYIYINPLKCGNIDNQTENNPMQAYQCCDEDTLLRNISNVLEKKVDSQKIKKQIEARTINPTDFFVWFVENYPKSKEILKENPDFQKSFLYDI